MLHSKRCKRESITIRKVPLTTGSDYYTCATWISWYVEFANNFKHTYNNLITATVREAMFNRSQSLVVYNFSAIILALLLPQVKELMFNYLMWNNFAKSLAIYVSPSVCGKTKYISRYAMSNLSIRHFNLRVFLVR